MTQENNFVPTDLESILEWLDKNVPQKNKTLLLEKSSAAFHFSVGRWMRNNWGFWDQNSAIWQWFAARGLWHGDDLSGVVFESFERKLRGQPINLAGQIKHYQEFWKDSWGDESRVTIEVDEKTGKYKIVSNL